MSKRSKRTSKAVNYADLAKCDSDDDFIDSPPSNKTKSTKVKKCTKSDKENELPVIKESETLRRKSPKHRLSIEEKKYEKDLKTALALSTASYSSGVGNEDEIDLPHHSCTQQNSLSSTEHSDINYVSEISISDTMKINNDVVSSVTNDSERNVLNEISTDLNSQVISCGHITSPNIAVDNTENELYISRKSVRSKKTVSFIEDETDEWSDSDAVSDDDGEDYEVKPRKKKALAKSSTLSDSKKKLTSQEPLICSKNSQSSPKLKVFPIMKRDLSELYSSTNIKKSISLPVPSSAPMGGINIVKTPFRSPTQGNCISKKLNSTQSAKTGLRLGLSRRVMTKSLHPNASIQ